MVSGSGGGPNIEPSDISSATWNLVWNSGRLYPEYQGPTINGAAP